MATDYDPIARWYRQAKRHPWRTHVEAFTLRAMLGDLAGRSAIDLACGEGHYTRRLRRWGAGRVLGVDRSPAMIALACAEESESPLGVAYEVGDCTALAVADRFDLAVAAYLLNYATSREDLRAMARAVAGCLGPGGRFVAMNANPDFDFAHAPNFRRYGFEIRPPADAREGAPYTWTFHVEDGPIAVENYRLPASAHEEALAQAGFRELRWHRPQVSAEGLAAFEPGYWDDLLEHPPVIGLDCRL